MLTDLNLAHSGATDGDVRFVASHFPHLTKLSLEGCDSISDVSLAELARSVPALKELHLLGCRDVSDHGLQALLFLHIQLREGPHRVRQILRVEPQIF